MLGEEADDLCDWVAWGSDPGGGGEWDFDFLGVLRVFLA